MKLVLLPGLSLALVAIASPALAQTAHVKDLQTAQSGNRMQILVELDAQPRSAYARIDGGRLVIELDGLSLAPSAFSPPEGAMATRVTITPSGPSGSMIALSVPMASAPTATVYRNAVLVETTLDRTAAPEAVEALAGGPDAAAGTAVSDVRCNTAKVELDKDAWNIVALGDHALCLIAAGKHAEAANRIDQLAAFNPDDPRVAIARARLPTAPSQKPAASPKTAQPKPAPAKPAESEAAPKPPMPVSPQVAIQTDAHSQHH